MENENWLLVKMNEELIRKYDAQIVAVGKNARKLLNCVPTGFVGMAMLISRAIPKWCMTEMSEDLFFGENMRRI